MTKRVLRLVLVVLGVSALLLSACASTSAPVPPPSGQITVMQAGGAGMLIAECGSKSYISAIADYIIEGTVIEVESHWNEAKTSINTYTELAIDNYVKGVPFKEKKLTIITPGGKVGEIAQWVEDQPIFHEGKRVRIYLKKTKGEFEIVCAQFGVEELLIAPGSSHARHGGTGVAM